MSAPSFFMGALMFFLGGFIFGCMAGAWATKEDKPGAKPYRDDNDILESIDSRLEEISGRLESKRVAQAELFGSSGIGGPVIK